MRPNEPVECTQDELTSSLSPHKQLASGVLPLASASVQFHPDVISGRCARTCPGCSDEHLKGSQADGASLDHCQCCSGESDFVVSPLFALRLRHSEHDFWLAAAKAQEMDVANASLPPPYRHR